MFKKFTAAIGAVLLAVGMTFVSVAAPASAHTPTVTPTCSSLTVSLVSYEHPTDNPTPNIITVTIDSTVVEGPTNFGASFSHVYNFDSTVSHTWKVEIDAYHPEDPAKYDHLGDNALTGTTTPCAPPDLCPNIDGVQASVPDGLVVVAGQCVTPPCDAHPTYTYTYFASDGPGHTANSGVITVTGTGAPCTPLYVTATSWKFVGSGASPQTLDVVNYYTIDSLGTFPYTAPVSCGQGDIYASWTGFIKPADHLVGGLLYPPAGWEAGNFLHNILSGDGPNPTYLVQTDNGGLGGTATCVLTTVPEPPTFTDLCGTAKDAYSLPDVSGEHFTYQVVDNRVAGVGTVTITAVAETGYKFADAIDAAELTWSHDYTDVVCPNVVIPAPQTPTFVDVCGTDNDSYTLPTLGVDDHYTFVVNDQRVGGVGVVTIDAVADSGYEFSKDLTADQLQWSHTFTDESCVISTTDPLASTCLADETGLDSWIYVDLNPHVIYTIDGVNSGNPITNAYTSVPAGTYTVHADAEAGFTLAPKSGAFVTGDTDTHHSWVFTVQDKTSEECQLITHPAAEVDASFTNEVCSNGKVTSGFITVVFPFGQESDVQYTIDGTVVPFDGVNDTTSVNVQPGVHTVIATPLGADGLTIAFGNTTGVLDLGTGLVTFPFTVGLSTDETCDLTTLALTGKNLSVAGLSLMGAGMFLFGLGFIIVYTRRNYGAAN